MQYKEKYGENNMKCFFCGRNINPNNKHTCKTDDIIKQKENKVEEEYIKYGHRTVAEEYEDVYL